MEKYDEEISSLQAEEKRLLVAYIKAKKVTAIMEWRGVPDKFVRQKMLACLGMARWIRLQCLNINNEEDLRTDIKYVRFKLLKLKKKKEKGEEEGKEEDEYEEMKEFLNFI